MWKLRFALGCLGLGGSVGLAFTLSLLVLKSWTGGSTGQVFITFNQYHERLLETIVFPVWSILGAVASFVLLRRELKR